MLRILGMLGMLGSFDRYNLMLRINVGNVRNQCPRNELEMNVRKMFGMLGSFDGCKYT